MGQSLGLVSLPGAFKRDSEHLVSESLLMLIKTASF